MPLHNHFFKVKERWMENKIVHVMKMYVMATSQCMFKYQKYMICDPFFKICHNACKKKQT